MRTLLDMIKTRWVLNRPCGGSRRLRRGGELPIADFRRDTGAGGDAHAHLNLCYKYAHRRGVGRCDSHSRSQETFLRPVVRVIDPKTGKTVEDSPVAVMSNEEADLQAAYQVAEETFDRASVWSHVRFGQLTANLQEYLGANPDRVIYLQKIDRTIHLPKDIMIRWIMSDDTHPKPSVCDDPVDRMSNIIACLRSL